MDRMGEIDQFVLLEEKVDHFIDMVSQLKKERDALLEKLQIQEERMGDLTSRLESLKAGRDKAKQRVISLLEKIETVGI